MLRQPGHPLLWRQATFVEQGHFRPRFPGYAPRDGHPVVGDHLARFMQRPRRASVGAFLWTSFHPARIFTVTGIFTAFAIAAITDAAC